MHNTILIKLACFKLEFVKKKQDACSRHPVLSANNYFIPP